MNSYINTQNYQDLKDIEFAPFLYFNAHDKNYWDVAKRAIDVENTNDYKNYQLLETLFFSKSNINIIQKNLIKYIYYKTKGRFTIKPQNELTLIIVMKHVYNVFGRYFAYNIQKQLSVLNDQVIILITPGIITNLYQYYFYLNEIESNPNPLDYGSNTSSKGFNILRGTLR